MKSGLSLSALAAKIESNQAAKADHIVDTKTLEMLVGSSGAPKLMMPAAGSAPTHACRAHAPRGAASAEQENPNMATKRKKPKAPTPAAPKTKIYAWNFITLDSGGVIVLRAISQDSQDSIGVLKLVDGGFEFWRNGERRVRTKDFTTLFAVIDRIERAT